MVAAGDTGLFSSCGFSWTASWASDGVYCDLPHRNDEPSCKRSTPRLRIRQHLLFFFLRDVLGLMSCDATYVKGHACSDFYASSLLLSCGQACLELEESCSIAFTRKRLKRCDFH